MNDLIKNEIVEFWCYIQHKAESDTTKNHIHLFLQPSKKIDTQELKDYFNEIEIGSIIPLGCKPFRKSKFGDWYWYCLHDITYLMGKGLKRKYHYKKSDFVASDIDTFNQLVEDNKYQNKNQYIISLLNEGYSPLDLARTGLIGFNQIKYVQDLIMCIQEENARAQEIDTEVVTDYSRPQKVNDNFNIFEDFKI